MLGKIKVKLFATPGLVRQSGSYSSVYESIIGVVKGRVVLAVLGLNMGHVVSAKTLDSTLVMLILEEDHQVGEFL